MYTVSAAVWDLADGVSVHAAFGREGRGHISTALAAAMGAHFTVYPWVLPLVGGMKYCVPGGEGCVPTAVDFFFARFQPCVHGCQPCVYIVGGFVRLC